MGLFGILLYNFYNIFYVYISKTFIIYLLALRISNHGTKGVNYMDQLDKRRAQW